MIGNSLDLPEILYSCHWPNNENFAGYALTVILYTTIWTDQYIHVE